MASWFQRLKTGLTKTTSRLVESIGAALGRKRVDANTLGELEEALIAADLGPSVAAKLVAKLKQRKWEGDVEVDTVKRALADDIAAILAPVALIARAAVLVPLGALIPAVRTFTWERFSALSINPDFRRKPPEGDFVGRVRWQEAGVFVWSWALIGSTFVIGWQPLATALAILSLTAVLNQLRTLVAHLWENEGEAMTVTAQFLDSVNVPPPGLAAEIWAPVGLRYHALHHLMPSMPYHDLPEAHRRLARELGTGSTYEGANHPGMLVLVGRIARSTMGKKAA